MGLVLGRPITKSSTKGQHLPTMDLSEVDVPREILERVLSFVPAKECILSGRLVCKEWRDIVDSKSFWKAKCDDVGLVIPSRYHELIDWRRVYLSRPFGRNLVKNWNAEDGFQHWRIVSNGGHQMRVETNICPGADELPEELLAAGCRKAWVTSYSLSAKDQIIDLEAEGLTADMMDKAKPAIYFSEWWAGRFDCGCRYEAQVDLLSDQKDASGAYKVLHSSVMQGSEDQWQGREWKKVEETFLGYGEGVRKIRVTHSGNDTQFWAGHYGSKFTGTTLKVSLAD